MQWPEKIAFEVRRDLAEMCALSKDDWNPAPSLTDALFQEVALRCDPDLAKVIQDLSSKKQRSSKRGL